MKLSPSFQLPYVDPQGYEIVTSTDLQLLAERVDSTVAGFDARTAAVLSKPTLIRGLSANTYNGVVDAAGQPGGVTPTFDVVRYDNASGIVAAENGIWWSVDPAKRNPDCYVMASLQIQAHVNGALDVNGSWMRSVIRVWNASQNIGRVLRESYYATQYFATADEDGTIMMILRLRPYDSVIFSLLHSNAASSVYVSSASWASMTYLMPAS